MNVITTSRLAIAVFLASICVGALAEPNTCEDAYQGQMSDLSSGDQEIGIQSYYFNKLCRSDGSVNSTNVSNSSNMVTDSVPVGQKFAFGSSHQTVSQFCGETAKSSSFASKMTWYNKTIVDAAQKNFNQCVALTASGLVLVHTYTAPAMVTILGRYNQSYTKGRLDSLSYDATKITCSTSSFVPPGQHPQAIAPDSGAIALSADFSIQCHRIPVHDAQSGGDYYPDAQIVASISQAGLTEPYQISVPADKAYGPALQSQAQTKIDELSVSAATSSRLAESLQAQNAKLEQALKDSTVVDVKYMYFGEKGREDQPGPKYYCVPDGNYEKEANLHAAELCAPNRAGHVFSLGDNGGNKCGYHRFLATCVAAK